MERLLVMHGEHACGGSAALRWVRQAACCPGLARHEVGQGTVHRVWLSRRERPVGRSAGTMRGLGRQHSVTGCMRHAVWGQAWSRLGAWGQTWGRPAGGSTHPQSWCTAQCGGRKRPREGRPTPHPLCGGCCTCSTLPRTALSQDKCGASRAHIGGPGAGRLQESNPARLHDTPHGRRRALRGGSPGMTGQQGGGNGERGLRHSGPGGHRRRERRAGGTAGAQQRSMGGTRGPPGPHREGGSAQGHTGRGGSGSPNTWHGNRHDMT